MSKINIDELLEILPKLIRENDTVKGAIITALSGVVATHEDLVELLKKMDKRFEAIQVQMDKRFEAMQVQMDKRFDMVDKRFEAMQVQMDKRFDTVDKRFDTVDKRFESLETNTKEGFTEIKGILHNIQQQIGKPFEQFGRNVIIKLLEKEGKSGVRIESHKINDPEHLVSKDTTDVEIDGFSLDPPIIVEITSILKDTQKVAKFLRKKQLVEKKYHKDFKGFFVAASTEFSPEIIGDIIVDLREHNCELINL